MNEIPNKYVHFIKDHNLTAPQEIVPHLINLFHPASVADVGCGLGTFLNIFLENGVQDITGIDGTWVDKSKLFIPEQYFIEKDLEQRFELKRKFDLVVCLEVAEHLKETSADVLVENLTSLGDMIIFSAAVVNQGGQNHINEQPYTYWVDKFKKRGFVFYDVFREKFWNNPQVDWWYKQNMFLVTRCEKNISPFLGNVIPMTEVKEFIHPELLAIYSAQFKMVKQSLKKLKEGGHTPYVYFSLLRKSLYKKFFSK